MDVIHRSSFNRMLLVDFSVVLVFYRLLLIDIRFSFSLWIYYYATYIIIDTIHYHCHLQKGLRATLYFCLSVFVKYSIAHSTKSINIDSIHCHIIHCKYIEIFFSGFLFQFHFQFLLIICTFCVYAPLSILFTHESSHLIHERAEHTMGSTAQTEIFIKYVSWQY